MKHPSITPTQLAKQDPLKPIGDYVNNVLVDTQETMLRQILLKKPTQDVVDALFAIVHLPDLLDFFKDEMTHYLSNRE